MVVSVAGPPAGVGALVELGVVVVVEGHFGH